MKISQLIATKNTKPYYESVASRLPRGIKSQQQLLSFGYSVAVRDLGLSKAKTLDENFAANLINSYHRQCLDEGIGSFLGKAAGHVAGAVGAAGRGLKGAWNDAKQGYKDAKATWDPTDPPGTHPNAAGEPPTGATPPAAGAAPGTPPAAGAAPGAAPTEAPPAASGAPAPTGAAPAAAAATGDISGIMQSIDKLDKPTKQQLAGELEKNIAKAPEPTAAPATAPAPAGTTPPAGKAPATPPAASGKLSPAQQAAMKAKLQGQRQAGKTTAAQTGSGFKDYVGGSQNKLTTNPDGSTSMKKLQRESVKFRSNFLGMII